MSDANRCGMHYSDLECSMLMKQIKRRAKFRQEFLKLKSNPFKHAAEAGYVFDEGMQRFNSMKVSQLNTFKTCWKTSLFGLCAIVLPMFLYGCLIWNQRDEREQLIRAGKIKYRDRLFKFQ